MTNRLYFSDAYQTEFETKIAEVTTYDKNPAILLDESCFYPTSGGQPFDVGTLTVIESGQPLTVVDVAAETGAPVYHILRLGDLDLVAGMLVRGTIDWVRRYDHMQQHSSQHLLSHALDSLLGYETQSVHFGTVSSTIDLSAPAATNGKESRLLSEGQLDQVEQYVNDVVYQNIPITAYFVADADLAKLPLRRPPKVTGQIRIVEIAHLDYSACGGTHCRQSGELGPIKLVKQERQKRNVRLTFVAGHRAMADYHMKHQVTSEVAAIFSNEISQLPEITRSLVEQNKTLEKKSRMLTQQLVRFRAEELWVQAKQVGELGLVADRFDDLEVDEAKQLATQLQAYERAVILIVIVAGGKLTAIFARGDAVDIHMGNLLRSTLAEFGGGGGGREDFAQGGGVPAATATALLAAAITQVESSAASM